MDRASREQHAGTCPVVPRNQYNRATSERVQERAARHPMVADLLVAGDGNSRRPEADQLFECPTELAKHPVCGRGSNGVVFDLENGRVLKVLVVDGRYPIYGRELTRVARLLQMAPPELFPRPTVVDGRGIEMDKVSLAFRNASPDAVTALLFRAVTLLKTARVCYTDFHVKNLGGSHDAGVLLDPDALCDPWSDPLTPGVYSPIGEWVPTVVDKQPVAAAALGWYCTMYSACCTALAAGDNHETVACLVYTRTRPGWIAAAHAKLQRLLAARSASISAPGFGRHLAALTDMEAEAYDHLYHIFAATGCANIVDLNATTPPGSPVCPGCSAQ